MKVCTKCKYSEKIRSFSPEDDLNPALYRCQHPACIDPVVGSQISCIEARNYSIYCGKYGDHYESIEEETEKDSKTTKIITSDTEEVA